ncbi:MAG: EutN/CcmL family microcompartment protein [Christensenellaceae bacterium]|nr:EutN/CcmL family microcompartment protein [Christensenellaceae bacterium]
MMIGRVKGNVVSTNKCAPLSGLKLLIVQPIDLETLQEKNDPIVCIDGIGAGEGELVMCVGGSSSRAAEETKTTPSDNSILAILDTIDIKGKRTYEKHSLDNKE